MRGSLAAGGGGIVGEIAGAFLGMGMPENEAKRHDDRAKRRGIPLFIYPYSSEWAKRAKESWSKRVPKTFPPLRKAA